MYIGKRRYQNELFDGKHKLTVSEDLFYKVQKSLDLLKKEKQLNTIAQNITERVRSSLVMKPDSLELVREDLALQLQELEDKIKTQEHQTISKQNLQSIFQRYIEIIGDIDVKEKRINQLLFERLLLSLIPALTKEE